MVDGGGGQSGGGQAAVDDFGAVLQAFEAVPDRGDDVVQAGGGDVGQHGALDHRVGAEYSATLCDLGVFMDEPAEPVASDDLDVGVDGVG
jgi:hypothetical protein